MIRIRPKSGPEARFLARNHYCAIYGSNLGVKSTRSGAWDAVALCRALEPLFALVLHVVHILFILLVLYGLVWKPSGVARNHRTPRFSTQRLAEPGSMLRNNASGPKIGLPRRILAGLLPGKNRNRPSGRPKAGRRADFGSLPVAVRAKSGPEGRCPARKHYCVT